MQTKKNLAGSVIKKLLAGHIAALIGLEIFVVVSILLNADSKNGSFQNYFHNWR